MRVRVAIGILAGDFASQQLAYAHLLDACPDADLEQVEVVARPFGARLAQWFGAEMPAALDAVSESSLVVTFPGAGVPLRPTDRLRVVGRFDGTLTRALMD